MSFSLPCSVVGYFDTPAHYLHKDGRTVDTSEGKSRCWEMELSKSDARTYILKSSEGLSHRYPSCCYILVSFS